MNTLSSRELSLLDSCANALARAERLDELTYLRSRAEAIRVWAKNANQNLELQNRAAALRLPAERKAGKLLAQLPLRGGDKKSSNRCDCLVLRDLGITQNQSTRWQKEALIPDERFEEYVNGSMLVGREITASGLLRLATESWQGQKIAKRRRNQLAVARELQRCRSNDLRLQTNKDLATELNEAINHVSLLQQVLTP